MGSFRVGSAMRYPGLAGMIWSWHHSRSSNVTSMCRVEQMSKPATSPCNLPMAMSSRVHRTSCSRVLKTSGPMKPATSLKWTHDPSGWADSSSSLIALVKPYLRDSRTTMSTPPAPSVGEVCPLSRLEIKAVSVSRSGPGVVHHLRNGDIERLVHVVRPGKALEHDGHGPGILLLHRGLDVDVRKHAPGNDVLEPEGLDDILERLLHGGDALHLAVHGVGPQHHVAHRIGETVEHLPHYVLRIVGG